MICPLMSRAHLDVTPSKPVTAYCLKGRCELWIDHVFTSPEIHKAEGRCSIRFAGEKNAEGRHASLRELTPSLPTVRSPPWKESPVRKFRGEMRDGKLRSVWRFSLLWHQFCKPYCRFSLELTPDPLKQKTAAPAGGRITGRAGGVTGATHLLSAGPTG